MGEVMLWATAVVVLVYLLLPWIITRMFGIGVYRQGIASGHVSFTFDDGPDPRFTPKLLDLLKKYGVKATFFIVGANAERYPHLIKRIHEEGHLIGIHNYRHISNWILTPWAVKRQVERTADIIETITGDRPVYYRPPWGILNSADLFVLRKYKIVLWSILVGDWSTRVGSLKIKGRLISKIQDGDVILLHDCGETFGADVDAPLYMLYALEDVLKSLNDRHYRCIRIDQMMRLDAKTKAAVGSLKKAAASIWLLWEKIFASLFEITPVDQSNTFLKFRMRDYAGKNNIVLDDGEMIRKGDPIIELHLDNEMLFKIGAEARSPMHLSIQLIRNMEQMMPQLLQLILSNPVYRNVKALYGISLIHRGPEQFGFTIKDLPDGIFSFFTKRYLRLLMYMIHPHGRQRLNRKAEQLVPKIIAMSKRELMNRYMHRLNHLPDENAGLTNPLSTVSHIS